VTHLLVKKASHSSVCVTFACVSSQKQIAISEIDVRGTSALLVELSLDRGVAEASELTHVDHHCRERYTAKGEERFNLFLMSIEFHIISAEEH
jgi:hypothetical protein